jgi:hypothetical protein
MPRFNFDWLHASVIARSLAVPAIGAAALPEGSSP